MTAKRIFQLLMVVALLTASFGLPGGVFAGGGCASYITVQWGDTVESIAAMCGTTTAAIQAANPGLGWWLYAGQVLYIPTGTSAPAAPASSGTHTVQWGDTLGDIALIRGVSLSDLLAVNPQIWNINLIYPGQVINIPSVSAPSSAYAPPPFISAQPLYKNLKVSYGYGLVVRMGPGKEYAAIDSIYVSAVKDSVWEYRRDSATLDSQGYVWVEVKLHPYAPASVGWLLVRDTLGKYYTEPLIDP